MLRVLLGILDAIPSPIFYKDISGIYRFCNKAFAEFLGRPKEEIVGKSVYEVSPRNLAQKYYEMDTELFIDRKVQIYENQVKNKNNELRDVLFNKAPYFDQDGRIVGLVGVILDITERKKLENALLASEAKYRALFNNLMDGFIYLQGVADETGTVVDFQVLDVNSGFEALTGMKQDELIGLRISESIFQPGKMELDWISFMNRVCTSQTSETFEYYSNVLQKWLKISAYSPQTNCCALVFSDITSQKTNIEEAEHFAYHDPLTGLPNRRLLEDRLSLVIAQARRKKERAAVVFLDLDNFKRVNDTLGHEVGDILLKEFAVRLQACVRESDTVSRLGGDEFVVILPSLKTKEEANMVALRILEESRNPFFIASQVIKISTSIGISFFPEDGDDIANLTRNADTAMYLSKKLGRDRICYASEH